MRHFCGRDAFNGLPSLLDVLYEYDCGSLRRAPCIHAALRRLATEAYEICGLAGSERWIRFSERNRLHFSARAWVRPEAFMGSSRHPCPLPRLRPQTTGRTAAITVVTNSPLRGIGWLVGWVVSIPVPSVYVFRHKANASEGAVLKEGFGAHRAEPSQRPTRLRSGAASRVWGRRLRLTAEPSNWNPDTLRLILVSESLTAGGMTQRWSWRGIERERSRGEPLSLGL
jgi:hypothetical protein